MNYTVSPEELREAFKRRMEVLVRELNLHTLMYDMGQPVITDQAWDDMYFELQHIEKELGEVLPDSPTQKVVYQIVNNLQTVEHNHPMLSLDKTKDVNVINEFIKGHDWTVMAKMDGLTCSLHYVDGRLISAETRGNGITGEDITHNAFVVKNIPNRIAFEGDVTIDGEIICNKKIFEEKFAEDYENPRNFASGSIRLLDSRECEKRDLQFIAWDIPVSSIKYEENLLSYKLALLIQWGFEVVPHIAYNCKFKSEFNMDDDGKLLHSWIDKENYPIDGFVFKYDDCKEYEACGRTEHHFKGGMALKFYDKEYETWLNNIEWTMGRTGVLTPVAIFNPVDTGDSTIERASLHNISIMKELLDTPYQGQTITVCKMNDIIPQVVSAGREISKADIEGLEFKIPTECPICGARLEIVCEVDTEVLMCTNEVCEGKIVNRLEHFFGKKGLDIKGLSKATFEKLLNWEWIDNITDVFCLQERREEWIVKPGFGVKSVDNILTAIEEGREQTFVKFLSAIGIPMIGTTLSKEIVKYFDTYDKFREAVDNKYDFTVINKLGIEKCESIWNFDYCEADSVAKQLTFKKIEEPAAADNQLLDATKVAITGTLKLYKNRAALQEAIEAHGGKVVSSVTKNTNILINNDPNSSSSKNLTAERLGIPIMTEVEFCNLYLEN